MSAVPAVEDEISLRQDRLLGIVIRGMRKTPTVDQIKGVERSAALFDKAAASARDVAFEMRACTTLGPLFGDTKGWPSLNALASALRASARSLGLSELGKWHRFEIAKRANEIAQGVGESLFASTGANTSELELQKIFGNVADRVDQMGFACYAAATWLRKMNHYSEEEQKAAQAVRKGRKGTGNFPQLNERRMFIEAKQNGFDLTELARAVVLYAARKEETENEREERALKLAKSFQNRANSDGNAHKSKRRR